jgi:hypothetical protein
MVAALVGWMYDGQVAQDREGMIRFLMRYLPPEVFAGISGMLAARDAAAWTEMQLRVPELAASPGQRCEVPHQVTPGDCRNGAQLGQLPPG